MDAARPDVGIDTLRALLATAQRPPFVVEGPALWLDHGVDAAELAKQLAALRAEPDGGWAIVRGLSPEQAACFDRVKSYVGGYLSAPRTLLAAVHEVRRELIALVYVDAAPRGFEVMYRDAVIGGRVVFLAGDVFVRRAGRTQRWSPVQASRLVERVVERRLREAAPPPAPPAPARPAKPPPAARPAAPAAPAPKPTAREVPDAAVEALLLAAGDDVVARYAAGALAVRLKRWDLVAAAAAAGQGPPETIALARQHVATTAGARPDGAADNAVLDSLCQFDAYAALVALDAGGRCEAGFARYWAGRTRAALRQVVSDRAVRRAIFRGSDQRLAAAVRALDRAAAVEGAAAGGWPGLGDAVVEEFVARHPG